MTSGGRAAGASRDALWAEVRSVLDRLRATGDVELAARLEEALGRGEGAVHGVPEVADALAAVRVGPATRPAVAASPRCCAGPSRPTDLVGACAAPSDGYGALLPDYRRRPAARAAWPAAEQLPTNPEGDP